MVYMDDVAEEYANQKRRIDEQGNKDYPYTKTYKKCPKCGGKCECVSGYSPHTESGCYYESCLSCEYSDASC